jgi:hypothetical protein
MDLIVALVLEVWDLMYFIPESYWGVGRDSPLSAAEPEPQPQSERSDRGLDRDKGACCR